MSAYDFSTLYTTLPHNLIKQKLDLNEWTFHREDYLYLACNGRNVFVVVVVVVVFCFCLFVCFFFLFLFFTSEMYRNYSLRKHAYSNILKIFPPKK